jgi:hypothetical protein
LSDDATPLQSDEVSRLKNYQRESTWNIERGVLILDR